MKKSKIIIGAAAFTLTIAGFIATKANRNFFTLSGSFGPANMYATGTLVLNPAIFTTVQSGSLKVCILATTANVKIVTLVTVFGMHRIYRKEPH
jgi:hypothetical protein